MLRDLYHEMIVDHGRHPRNFAVMEDATAQQQGLNPMCGDQVTLYVREKNGVLEKISFQGSGCAIAMASASLLTEVLTGKSHEQAQQLFTEFHEALMQKKTINAETLGKLTILSGVAEYPARVKCATLAWHALMGALNQQTVPVSTE